MDLPRPHRPISRTVSRILNVILTHQGADAAARMLDEWGRYVPLENILIAAGGTRVDFETIAHPQKIFVEDDRLRTGDHQREFQSYTGVFRAVSKWLPGARWSHVSYCEYDHLPLIADFNARQLDRLTEEKADVLGCHVTRVDGTNQPHYLYHQYRAAFHEHWEKITRRRESDVILSMFGSGSFWTREAFDAVASREEPFRIYLEIYLPTLAHHLGFRVRDVADQNRFVDVFGDRESQIESARKAGAWAVHPVKHRWGPPIGKRAF